MQTLDWQEEQERRATEIREVLERTLTLAQTADLVEWVDNGWRYQGEEQTLVYSPDSDQLSVFSNDRSWQLNWHEDLFLPEADTQINDAQLAEFRELGQWLDHQEVSVQSPDVPTDALVTTARLFEQYARDGETAFKTAEDGTEHFYRVEVDEATYWISRDDATGTYSFQREDGVPLTEIDEALWTEIGQWLDQVDRSQPQLPETLLEAPYWEQQTLWASQILPQAEYVFAFQESQGNLQYEPDEQGYVTDSGDYQIGYSTITDTFWIEREGDRILSVSEYSQHRHDPEWEWSLPELHDLGELETRDVSWLESWTSWLQLKAEQLRSLPDWEASFNRLWENDRALLDQWESPQSEPTDDYDFDR
jgi:hypothetical protein